MRWLHPLDWLVILAYVAFAVTVGVIFARRAGRSVDEYFLSGRSLPWWVAGTSMVATTFASDTPLLISGWVRSGGISDNWAWWCLAIAGSLHVFLFARWWRRGGVMTKAELAELRYGGDGARALRGMLGFLHAGVQNTIILCWVLLAAAKISEVLFGVDKLLGLALACAVALSYSILAGFWGVVLTDMVQFAMAMAGAIVFAALTWSAVGGSEAVLQAASDGVFSADNLRFFPQPGEGSIFDASFWTAPLVGVAVFLGVQWWGAENVDGGGTAVQRIAAARDERQGMLAVLWFNVSHYALRPWCWILVGLASLLILPTIEVRASGPGEVTEVSPDKGEVVVAYEGAAEPTRIDVKSPEAWRLDRDAFADYDEQEGLEQGWHPLPSVSAGDAVESGDVLARTDPERAYVVMMLRYLPLGLLGLVAASLVAAFMSTIDTHVNLASSYFINDVYRRFLKKDAPPAHYILVARLTCAVVLGIGAILAWLASSISDLFIFFLAFLSGVGPVYVLRWMWWRVRASTEITAMVTSAITASTLTFWRPEWSLGPLSPDGELSAGGRLILVVSISFTAALISLALTKRPDPRTLTRFYRKVRPLGAWGPVRALVPDAGPQTRLAPALVGSLGGLAATYGLCFGIGFYFLGRSPDAVLATAVSVAGAVAVAWALKRVHCEPASVDGAADDAR